MNKSTIIIIIVAVLVGFGYFFVKGGSSSSGSALLQAGPAAAADGRAALILTLLNQVNTITIDANFFSSPVYQTLRDRSVPIPDQGVGRPNPFAPVR
ncbi:MAG: hypothetical protein AAB381_00180 [Patescibacteria group bacterium]